MELRKRRGGGGYSGGYGGKGATRARAGGAVLLAEGRTPSVDASAVAVKEAAEVTARARAPHASALSHGQSLSQQQSDMSAGPQTRVLAAGSCAGSPSLNAHDSEIADSDTEDAHESNAISCGGDAVDLEEGSNSRSGRQRRTAAGWR